MLNQISVYIVTHTAFAHIITENHAHPIIFFLQMCPLVKLENGRSFQDLESFSGNSETPNHKSLDYRKPGAFKPFSLRFKFQKHIVLILSLYFSTVRVNQVFINVSH